MKRISLVVHRLRQLADRQFKVIAGWGSQNWSVSSPSAKAPGAPAATHMPHTHTHTHTHMAYIWLTTPYISLYTTLYTQQEALQIDGSRADILVAYALYLCSARGSLPEETEKYYAFAMQASPHNEVLREKYEQYKEKILLSSGSSSSSVNIASRSSRTRSQDRLATKTKRSTPR